MFLKPFSRIHPWLVMLLIHAGGVAAFGQQIRQHEVSFAPGSSQIGPQAKAMLDTLSLQGVASISLYGYAADGKTPAACAALAHQRMDSVAAYLRMQHPLYHEVFTKPDPKATGDRKVVIALVMPAAPDTAWRKPLVQTFVYDPAKPQKIVAPQGTVLQIPANAFTINGQPVTDPVTVELVEAYTYGDMLRNQLSTMTSDGQLLETGGMFRLDASVNGVPVDKTLRNPITASLPADSILPGMQVFVADENAPKDGPVVWRLAKNAPPIGPAPLPDAPSAAPQTGRTLSDSCFSCPKRGRSDYDPYFPPPVASLALSQRTIYYGYNLAFNNIGWINCDRFYTTPQNEKISMVINSSYGIVILIYFEKRKAMMNNFGTKIYNIPKNEKIVIVAYDEVANKAGMLRTTAQAGTIDAPAIGAYSIAEVQTILDQLNNQ